MEILSSKSVNFNPHHTLNILAPSGLVAFLASLGMSTVQVTITESKNAVPAGETVRAIDWLELTRVCLFVPVTLVIQISEKRGD